MILLSWCLEILGGALFFNPACLSERYNTRKTLVDRNPEIPNCEERNRIKQQ
jgi:hypothetical protein